MFVVTFYSYKGGVGRTLSLVNCAQRLAKQGKKVFILDFDLEAPGVDAFPLCGDARPRQGIVEYVSRFTSAGSVEDLRDYVYRPDCEEFQPGEIHVMSAGRKDEHYQVLLSRLDWRYFYKQQKGFLFVENLKAAIESNYHPDYVLVDSRTGLTDVSGICTLQLPDLVVLLFSLNNQNLDGISHIYRSIRSNRYQKDTKTLLVASPIADIPDYFKIRRERLEYAQKLIGAENIDLVLPFDPFVTFEETIVGGGEKGTHLGKSYDKLANRIVLTNKQDVLTVLTEANDLLEEGEIDQADLKYRELIKAHPEQPRAFLEYGRFRRMTGKRDAIKYLEKARALNPQDPELVGQLIRGLLRAKRTSKAVSYAYDFISICDDSEELESTANLFVTAGEIEPAVRLYQKAIEVSKQSSASSHLELGNLYMRMKKVDEASEQFEIAARAEPESLPAVYNYGYVLQLKRDPRATEFFLRAVELFEHQSIKDRDQVDKANQLQAMSHAYAAIGNVEKARKLLENAIQIARRGGAKREIFSSIQYKNVNRSEFIEESSRLANKLLRA